MIPGHPRRSQGATSTMDGSRARACLPGADPHLISENARGGAPSVRASVLGKALGHSVFRAILLSIALAISMAPAACAGETDHKYVWTVPCVQADSVRCDTIGAVAETTLKEARFWAVRFGDNDTLYLGAKPLRLRGCYQDSILMTWLNGSMFELLQKHVDQAGNVACMYAHVVDVVPADSTWADRPGLLGSYFSDQNLTQLFGSRVDPAIDFDWSTGVALAGMPGDWFSVRWVGKLRAGAAGLYTFRLRLNDAGRLWVGATNVIDDWAGDGDHSITGVASLAAGASLDLRLEMFEKTGSARTTLYWTPPGGTEEIVPAGAFSH